MIKSAISKCVASFLEEIVAPTTKGALRAHVAKSTGIDILQKGNVWRPFFTKCVHAYTNPNPPSDEELCSVAMLFVTRSRSKYHDQEVLQLVHEHVEQELDQVLTESARDVVTAEVTLQLRSDINLPEGEVPEFHDLPDEVCPEDDDHAAASDPAVDTFIKHLDSSCGLLHAASDPDKDMEIDV